MASSTCGSRQQNRPQKKKKFAGKNANDIPNGIKQKNIKLFEDEEEEDDTSIKVNTQYAKKYDHWKKKEEQQKLVDRYGKDAEDLEESSSEEEDENGDRLPADFDKNFLHTLACLRKKDSSIYNKDHRFFSDEAISLAAAPEQKKSSDKPMYLHDYEREVLLSNNGKPIDEEEGKNRSKKEKRPQTYVEEQDELKNSFKKALEDSDDDGDALFVTSKKKSAKKSPKKQKGLLSNKEIKSEIKNVWSDEINENEAFLRDFILQQKHIDEDNKNRVPTYEEIIASSDEEEFIEVQADFEQKYNFRFEEPDPEFIKKYPRTIEQTYRPKETKRSEKRSEVKERKQKEKEQKVQELKRLKALKRTEIMEKLEKIKQITGNTKVGFGDVDLSEDFNPEEHDKKMQQIFDEEYYEEEETEEPELPFEEEDLQVDNWDEWDGNNEEPHCEDPDFVMDCDYDPSAKESPEKEKASGKKKKRGVFRNALRNKKPIFDPTSRTFEDYFDEYYKLDYEDIIGDLPCRFKYRNVAPNDFGLSLDELLVADDKELNQWCSLRKACQYRSEEEEKYDIMAYEKQAKNLKKKMKILKSVYQTEEEDDNAEEPQETRDNKATTVKEVNSENGGAKSPKKNRKRKISHTEFGRSPKRTKNETQPGAIPDDRLKAYGINPKKFKNKLKYGKQAAK